MNEDTTHFIEDLKNHKDVLGIILFGSYARGNNRPNSDVDLIVILTEGYKRTVEYRNDQAFEIIYTTAKSAMDFWKSNINDCFGVWSVAKILYDKDSTIQSLQKEALEIIKEGKKLIDEDQVKQFKFSAEDEIAYVIEISEANPAIASLVLQNTVKSLIELYFDLRREWTPAPKQQLLKIGEADPGLYENLNQFYTENVPLLKKAEIAKDVLKKVFTY